MELVLAQGWIYAGKRYGPGAIDPRDIPEEALEALAKKGAFGEPPQEIALPIAADGDPLAQAVGKVEAQALRDMGFDSPETIAAASDEDLTAVPGIGPGKLVKLRALAGGGE